MRTTEVATITGRGIADDGSEFALSPSASHSGASHVVREIGPEGQYLCDCESAQFHPERRCRHIDALIDVELAEALLALKVRHEAAGARQAVQMARYQELSAWDESQVR